VQTGAVTAMPPDQNAAAGLVDFNRNQGSGRRGKTSTEQECIFDRRYQPDFGARSSG
jgi:hypothetical protein